MVTLKDLTAGYENTPIIQNINMDIKEGEIVGLLGHNGSGKTTLALTLLGFTKIFSGKAEIDGINVKKEKRKIRKLVSMLMQVPDNQLFARTIYEELAIAPYKRGLSQTEIENIVNTIATQIGMKDKLHYPVHKLSFGQKKKVAMGVLLSIDPKYYILDEPMAGLDFEGRSFMENTIRELKERGKGILLISHDVLSLTLCHRIYIMQSGKIVEMVAGKNLRDIIPELPQWGLYMPTL